MAGRSVAGLELFQQGQTFAKSAGLLFAEILGQLHILGLLADDGYALGFWWFE